MDDPYSSRWATRKGKDPNPSKPKVSQPPRWRGKEEVVDRHGPQVELHVPIRRVFRQWVGKEGVRVADYSCNLDCVNEREHEEKDTHSDGAPPEVPRLMGLTRFRRHLVKGGYDAQHEGRRA